MTIREIREAYEAYSSALTKFNRELAIAGVAAVWLFMHPESMATLVSKASADCVTLPMLAPEWRLSLMCFVLSLVCDMFQYLYQSVVWYWFYCRRMKDVKRSGSAGDPENVIANEPENLNIPAWLLWGMKCVMTIGGYLFFAIALW